MSAISVFPRSVPATLRRAAAVHPICDLQIEYSLISRGIEDAILPATRELGIGITAYGVLSRGLISGHWRRDAAKPGDFRAHQSRASRPAMSMRNLALVAALRAIAAARDVSVAQMAIAWVMAQGDDIVPVVGARSRDAAGRGAGRGVDVALTPDDLAAIERAPCPRARRSASAIRRR